MLARILAVLLSGIGCAGVYGCGSAPPAPVVAAHGEAAALKLLVTTEGSGPSTKATTDAVTAALVRAGFQVVVDEEAEHDARLVLRLRETEERSLLQVQINGKTRQTTRVDATLLLVADGRVVSEAVTQPPRATG